MQNVDDSSIGSIIFNSYSYSSNSMQTNTNNSNNYQIVANLSRNPLINSNNNDRSSWSFDYNMSTTTRSTTNTSSHDASVAALRSLYFSIENKLAILPVFLMIAGTFGNCLAFYVLTRRRLRNQSTMLYFAALTLMDTLALYQWSLGSPFFLLYSLTFVNMF